MLKAHTKTWQKKKEAGDLFLDRPNSVREGDRDRGRERARGV